METDANGQPEKKTRKVKKQVRKGELPISSGTTALEEATKHAWAEKENAMAMEDKLVADTDEKKNELESYIYELRDKIETTYAEFSSEEEKEKLRARLTESEVGCLPPSVSKRHFLLTHRLGLAVRGRRRHDQGHLRFQDGRDPVHRRTDHPAIHGQD